MNSKGLPDESGHQSLKTTKVLKKLLKHVFVTTVSFAHLKACTYKRTGRQFNGDRAGRSWAPPKYKCNWFNSFISKHGTNVKHTDCLQNPFSYPDCPLGAAAGEALELHHRVLSLPKPKALISREHEVEMVSQDTR